MKEGTNYYFYHTDHLGTPQKITAINGAVVWAAKYSSFGEATVDAASIITNNLRFPGQYYDQETGLHWNWHRYYDPKTGRYLTPDPIGLAGGINLFSYVWNNPGKFIDPHGLTWSTNWKFLKDWVTGSRGSDIFYGADTIETQEMKKSPGGNALRDAFYSRDCKSINKGFHYGTGQAAWDTIFNPTTADWSGTGAQVGGFAGASSVNNGNGTVTFTIPNVVGTKSFFYHIVPDRKSKTGPMHNINQTFQWTEKIDESKCKKCEK